MIDVVTIIIIVVPMIVLEMITYANVQSMDRVLTHFQQRLNEAVANAKYF